MALFSQVTSVDPNVFYKRNDPNDVRLGEVVQTRHDDYAAANIVILGLPQDEGVRRNQGRPGSRDAPDAIRRCLYKFVAIQHLRLFDAGNTTIQSTLEATHAVHREVVHHILRDGKCLVILGGGNDISYPDASALALATQGEVLAFNIDAHFDVRLAAVPNSGTPYRQLLEEGHILPQNFYEIAYQPFANSDAYIDYLVRTGVQAYDLASVHEIGLEALLRQLLNQSHAQAVFWGLDIDVVRAGDAPGVSALNPTGLTGEEFCRIGRVAGHEQRTRIFEISEVNPHHDIDERTCRLAAAAVWQFLAAYTQRVMEGHDGTGA